MADKLKVAFAYKFDPPKNVKHLDTANNKLRDHDFSDTKRVRREKACKQAIKEGRSVV